MRRGPARTPADERGLTFLGLVALRDVPDPSAAAALGVLARRGVAVKVLTGDHPGTAARICSDLGLHPGGPVGADDVVTADSLDGLSDAELVSVADRATVFARCTPEHKARIVAALRAGGHTTGFLGDGVNDLAALHAADVGICPRNAVDVAREAADVVLAEKNLTAIGHAVLAGRRSSGNIAAYLRITLSSNLGNVIAMLTAGLMLPFLPMLPAQVLVQNLCFDAAQLAFAFDRPAASALRRPTELRPRDFLRFITGFGLLNAAADLATFGVLALALHNASGDSGEAAFDAGWFTENLLTQALVMVLLRTGRGGASAGQGGPEAPGLTAVTVGLGWDVRTTTGADHDLDASALLCSDAGKVLSDSHFVFYNNLNSPDGSVRHTGDNLTGEGEGDDESVEGRPCDRSPPRWRRSCSSVSIHDAQSRGQSFGQVRNAFIRVVNRANGVELARYDLNEDASTETATGLRRSCTGTAPNGSSGSSARGTPRASRASPRITASTSDEHAATTGDRGRRWVSDAREHHGRASGRGARGTGPGGLRDHVLDDRRPHFSPGLLHPACGRLGQPVPRRRPRLCRRGRPARPAPR
ncbi:Potassium-transporting ATPase ATP-binding subunit [Streptomyces californicus]